MAGFQVLHMDAQAVLPQLSGPIRYSLLYHFAPWVLRNRVADAVRRTVVAGELARDGEAGHLQMCLCLVRSSLGLARDALTWVLICLLQLITGAPSWPPSTSCRHLQSSQRSSRNTSISVLTSSSPFCPQPLSVTRPLSGPRTFHLPDYRHRAPLLRCHSCLAFVSSPSVLTSAVSGALLCLNCVRATLSTSCCAPLGLAPVMLEPPTQGSVTGFSSLM